MAQGTESDSKSKDVEMTVSSGKRDFDMRTEKDTTAKRSRGVSPDSAASSPDTIGSSPESPHAPPPALLSGSSNGPACMMVDVSDERTQGRSVLDKKLLKYQQLLATRRQTEALS